MTLHLGVIVELGSNGLTTVYLDVWQFESLELDKTARPLVSCPLLLDAASYMPDTEDLTQEPGCPKLLAAVFRGSHE